ncbi:hypothetical protein [Dipodfec virus UOA04_Rod_565]|nr:hypothetical protein [Dipodfec virus UOA04_Rod_565]
MTKKSRSIEALRIAFGEREAEKMRLIREVWAIEEQQEKIKEQLKKYDYELERTGTEVPESNENRESGSGDYSEWGGDLYRLMRRIV